MRADPRMLHLRILSAAGWRLLLVLMLACPAVVLEGIAASHVAFAQGAKVSEIRVVGNRRVEPETVRSYLQFNVGDQYDAGKVDRSLKTLFATGLFADGLSAKAVPGLMRLE